MGKMMKFGLMTGLASIMMLPQAATAGPDSPSLFSRDRNTSVMEREREGYEPLGIRSGSFIVRPRLDLTIAYTDNVFAVGKDSLDPLPTPLSDSLSPFADQEDFYGILRPSILAESDWNNHSIRGGAYLEAFRHVDFDSENVANAGAFVDGTLDIYNNAMLMAGASYDLLHEGREVTNQPAVFEEPIEYTRTNLYVGGQQELGRIRYRGRLDYRTFDYEDAEVRPGFTAAGSQQFRDRDEYIATAQVGWALTRDASVFLRGTYNIRDHDLQGRGPGAGGPNRDSTGWALLAGVDFDITNLVRGNIAVGYMEQEYDDTSLLDGTSVAGTAIDGVGIDAGLEWFPTELTTVGLAVSRSIRDSQLFEAVGYTAEEVGIRVDHELRRNIVLSASVTAGRDEYEGIDLEYDRVSFGIGGTYFINRNLRASLNYSHTNQDAEPFQFNGEPSYVRDYDRNELFLTLTAQR